MPRPIVALLTDFGTADHYVGALKGAVLAACREATLVDITHDLPAHDVEPAARALAATYRAFPAGTVFVAVVDPGVGSERQALALEAGGYFFVGPDNGVFSEVLIDHPDARVHAITNQALFRLVVSPTFHGRDIFAPVAGRLAAGMALAEVGSPVGASVRLPRAEVIRRSPIEWEGAVLGVDRFGNLTTTIDDSTLTAILGRVDGDPTRLLVHVLGLPLPLVLTYAEVHEGEPCALLGSSRRLELAVNRGHAARLLGAVRGTPVQVRVLPEPPE